MYSNAIGNQRPRIAVEPPRSYTDGEDASELAKAYGLNPDEWQRLVLDAWLGRDENDSFTATTCGLSVPRQNGKNALIEIRCLYGLCCIGEQILHSAHEVRTANEAFRRLCGFFENPIQYPELAEMVDRVSHTNGKEGIYLTNGASIRFVARSKGTARGMSLDCIILDECQFMSDEQMEAMMSTLASAPLGNRQVIMTGTPPTPTLPCEVFGRTRENAINGTDNRLVWHEWSIEALADVDVSDKSLWYATNPALGIRLSEEFTETEFNAMSRDGFARERLGFWRDFGNANALIPKSLWDACKTAAPAAGGHLCYAVKFSPDGATGSISVCRKPAEGKPHIELVCSRPMSDGLSYFADFIEERKDRAAMFVIDGKSNAQTLADELRRRRIPKRLIALPKSTDVSNACAGLLNAIHENAITHIGQEELDDSATKSKRRNIGNDGGWGFADNGSESTYIESCALALWGALNPKRDPNRKAKVAF